MQNLIKPAIICTQTQWQIIKIIMNNILEKLLFYPEMNDMTSEHGCRQEWNLQKTCLLYWSITRTYCLQREIRQIEGPRTYGKKLIFLITTS